MNPPAWHQANIAFPDWHRAETTTLAHLAPLLRSAEDTGAISIWFIVRKRPCWRMRYQPRANQQDRIAQSLDALTTAGHITKWTESIYEPEVHAFGGTEAMACAHRLFHHDSRNLIDHLNGETRTHRRETSLILCSLLLRSAGLDWYEQGDVWARVCAHRPTTPSPNRHDDRVRTAVHRLISVNPEDLMRKGGTLAHAAGWADAYTDAGQELAHLTNSGLLRRGLRDVLAHHVLFAWNRLGLPYDTQATLAAAAKTSIFGPDPTDDRSAGHAATT